MTFSSLADVLLGIAVIAYLGSRQLRWQPVNPAKMWRLPIVLGVVGVLSLSHTAAPSTLDLTLIAVSAVAAVGCGAAMGRITTFRTTPAGGVESRAGWAGVGVWVLLIAVRVLTGVAGHWLGSALASSTGMILLTVGLATAATALVTSARLPRHPAPVAGR